MKKCFVSLVLHIGCIKATAQGLKGHKGPKGPKGPKRHKGADRKSNLNRFFSALKIHWLSSCPFSPLCPCAVALMHSNMQN